MDAAYSINRHWSDQFIPENRRIVGAHLLSVAPDHLDMRQATDLLMLDGRDVRIAARVRRHGYAGRYPYDFTIPSRLPSGTLSDGTVLFDSSRGNVVSMAAHDDDALPLLGALSAARLAMRHQRNLDMTTPIQATPRYIVAGPEIETDLEQLLATNVYSPSPQDVNPFAGKLQLLIDPRIDGEDWYVFADPAQCAVFNIAHLAAAPGPQIQRQENWDTLGVSFRCWMDTGVGFAGWRGAVKVGA